ncbi:hypothetical protein KSS87_003864 [Heliosperma pusillum]|nr:hypothetical protein KSS87_003864 [Heliosperma pusillum]
MVEIDLTLTMDWQGILANQRSAARSKEKKIKYTTELEKEVQTLKTQATNLSTESTLLEKDALRLSAENKDLKLRQALEEQAKLRDVSYRLRCTTYIYFSETSSTDFFLTFVFLWPMIALKESLRKDVDRSRMECGLPISNNGSADSDVFHLFLSHLQNLLQQQFQMLNQNQASPSGHPNQQKQVLMNQNQASTSHMSSNPNSLGFNQRPQAFIISIFQCPEFVICRLQSSAN